jgi:hypothetical protein
LLIGVAEIDCEVVLFDAMAWLLILAGADRPGEDIVEVGVERIMFLCGGEPLIVRCQDILNEKQKVGVTLLDEGVLLR